MCSACLQGPWCIRPHHQLFPLSVLLIMSLACKARGEVHSTPALPQYLLYVMLCMTMACNDRNCGLILSAACALYSGYTC